VVAQPSPMPVEAEPTDEQHISVANDWNTHVIPEIGIEFKLPQSILLYNGLSKWQ